MAKPKEISEGLQECIRANSEGYETGTIEAFEWVIRLCNDLDKSETGSPHHFEMIDIVRTRAQLELDRRYPKPNDRRRL